MLMNLPENWTLYEGEGAGSPAEIVREFDLIDGRGERMASRREGGTGRHETKKAQPQQPRARLDVLESRVGALEDDVRSIKQDLREMKGQLSRIIEILAGEK